MDDERTDHDLVKSRIDNLAVELYRIPRQYPARAHNALELYISLERTHTMQDGGYNHGVPSQELPLLSFW